MEEIKEYNKKYYETHKEKIQSRMNEKVDYEICHKKISRSNLPKHQRTRKCQSVNMPKVEYDDKMKKI